MHVPTSRRAAGAILAACVALTLSAGAGAALARQGDTLVTIKSFDFHPMTITVPAGATVTWKNLDAEPHAVTSTDGAFHSPALDQDDTFSFKFARPGVYKYLCTIHPRMVASVTVK